MNLYKTSFWSIIYTTFKMLAGIITTKIMAVIVGPSGVAAIGTFANVSTLFATFSSGAINTGVTKYISEFDDEEKKRSVVAHALKINLLCSIIMGALIVCFNKVLSLLIFKSTNLSSVFVLLGFSIVFFGFNLIVTAIFNGYREVKLLIFAGMIGSLIQVVLAYFMTVHFGMFGALINSIVAQVFIFALHLYFLKRTNFFSLDILNLPIDKVMVTRLFKFSLMGLSTLIAVPTCTLLIRNHIIVTFSTAEAGYVQGVWNISAAYLAIVTTALSIYYLPTLSSTKEEIALRKEILSGYMLLIPVAIISGLLIFLLKDLIIKIMYTPEFLPMRSYFVFQLIGDTLKIASFLLGYLCVAKAMTKQYIQIEIIFSITYLVLAYIFMNRYGSVGVTYAYALNYTFSLGYLIFLFRKLIFIKPIFKQGV